MQKTITELVEEYLEYCRAAGFSYRTIQSYKSALRPWTKFITDQGVEYLHEITRDTLLEYRNYLHTKHRSPKGKPLSVSTQIHKISTLRSWITYCNETHQTFLTAKDLPKPKKMKTLPKGILSKQKIKKLLQLPDSKTTLGKRDRVILELFYGTGIRRKELVAIELEDCQISEKRLFVRDGKGGKQRWVPLGKEVCKILQEYIAEVRPLLVKKQKHNYLVVANKGGRMYGPKTYTIVKKYLKMIGIESDCHGLRHTCATHLLKGNANLRVIQSILGHESLSSTQIYTHVEMADMAKAIAKAHPRESMDFDE